VDSSSAINRPISGESRIPASALAERGGTFDTSTESKPLWSRPPAVSAARGPLVCVRQSRHYKLHRTENRSRKRNDNGLQDSLTTFCIVPGKGNARRPWRPTGADHPLRVGSCDLPNSPPEVPWSSTATRLPHSREVPYARLVGRRFGTQACIGPRRAARPCPHPQVGGSCCESPQLLR